MIDNVQAPCFVGIQSVGRNVAVSETIATPEIEA